MRGKAGRREAMSRVDTAWLRMERPTNPMMITGVLMFAEPLGLDALRRIIAQRFLAYPRFRHKAVELPTGAYWEEDADFELDWHVRLVALPGRAGHRELERMAGQLASTQLDKARPLWQFHLVERYEGGSALIARIHHCYADGIALVQVLLSLTDTTADARPGTDLARSWLRKDGARVPDRFLGQSQLEGALKLGNKALEKGMELYRDPSLAAMLAREGGEIARELAHALGLPDDPVTRLKGPLGTNKRVAWADPLPLSEVKTLGRALCCTVNDVLLAAAAGALRAHLIEQGDEVDGLTVRATVPVNLRPLEHARKLGNHFGLVFLDLPIGEANPLRRLERVAQSMRELKQSRQAIVAFGLLAALGMAPAALQRLALELFSRKATTVATNVPGPQMPLYMGGSRLCELMFWVPQTGSIGLGLSILSYDGRVHFGMISDARRVPDPRSVTRRFRAELDKLIYIALMEDWEAPIEAADAAATLHRYVLSAPASSERAASSTRRRRTSRSR
ncbi:MAG TPA: wax ester/triacylglycerol synthase family O-acyltransferase [Xanthomonadaceae bacterium]|nr:wax ester/triacylglycerol synthase family O-acyltransferase [Xanthomonadaceae bacterium]